MVEKFLKFIAKSQFKGILLKVLQDIYDDNLSKYDVKTIEWKKWYYRLRKGNIRFIFKKTENWNRVIDIDNRWDIYKWIDKK